VAPILDRTPCHENTFDPDRVPADAVCRPCGRDGENNVPIAAGPCEPTWRSLGDHFKCPAWWRKAKIGMWLHWGPQAVGEDGDWYAKWIYMPKYA
jgi:hypothetical protein